jgi:hypothetical protein
MDQIANTDPADTETLDRLNGELEQFRGIRVFDKPRRDYNALTLTLTRRVSKDLYVQGSYTYSRAEGNYPGLVSYDNGQVDPNISSQYDLIELLANHDGPLPQDRPHYIKIDASYKRDFKKAGKISTGARFRALSGVPMNALARHHLYGTGESFLLPRGALGRTDFDFGLDLHLGYARKLNDRMELEVFTDLFNVFNRQGTASVDDNYTYFDNSNPIVGGTYEDLIWAKVQDRDGVETSAPIGRNPNFRNATVKYTPLEARLGARLTF